MLGNARVVRGRNDGVELFFKDARADHEIGYLAFLPNLPIDELFDIRMIRIENNHFCCATRCAARFNGAGSAIENLEKRHEAARRAAARKLFTGGAKLGKVSTRSGATLKNARFTDDAIENAAFVDEIVVNAKDIARRDLRKSERIR